MAQRQFHKWDRARALQIWRCNALAAAVAAALSGVAYCNPTAPVVVNGNATFGTNGSTLTVTNSPGAIINWKAFSINANETTRFVQQSAQSQVLNRVTGGNPSQILGTLSSNGQVFLINPNGIAFGAGARVDVAGLVASSLNLSNEDFLAKRLNFTATPGAGKVTNAGEIRAGNGGNVILVAPAVENNGVLIAPDGSVTLAAGKTVLLVDPAAPDIQVELTAPASEVLNIGAIIANRIGLYGGLVNHGGSMEATRAMVGADGTVTLKAADTTLVSGTIVAQGGQIDVLGNKVGLLAGAILDVSSPNRGGNIRIGGDSAGANPAIMNAQATYIDGNAIVNANATDTGNGGHIAVWSEQATRVFGQLSARGGPNGGNGGFIETSGKKYLEITSTPDASAPKGSAGNWLVDPYNNVIIQAGTDSNVTGNPNFTTTDDNAVVSVGSIQTALNAGTSVTITTASPASASQAGDITISSPIQSAGGNVSLTLSAANNIDVNAGISSASGQLDLNLLAGNGNAVGTSTIAAGVTVALNGGTLSYSKGLTLLGTVSGGNLVSNDNSVLTGNTALTGLPGILDGVTLGNATHPVLSLSGDLSAINNLILADAARVSLSSSGTLTVDGIFAGTGTLTNNGTITTVAGIPPATNATLGGTINNNGTIYLDNGVVTGTLTNTGFVGMTGNNSVASGAIFNQNGGNLILSDAVLNVDGALNWNSGTISGGGSLTINQGGGLGLAATGTRTLDGITFSNLNAPTTILGAGSLDILAGQLSTNDLSINAGGRMNVSGGTVMVQDGLGVLTVAGGVTSSGGAINAGTINVTGGTLTANGAGGTINANAMNLVNGGTLYGNGVVGGAANSTVVVHNASGVVSPGASPGTLVIQGSYQQDAAGALVMEIGGAASGSFDQLIARDGVTLNGSLQVSLLPGYVPEAGQTFQLVKSQTGNVTGTFSSTSVMPPGLTFVNIYQPSSLNLELASSVPPTLPADLQIAVGAYLVALDAVTQPSALDATTRNVAAAQDLAAQLQASLPGCIQ